MQQLTTVYQKYINQMTILSNPPLLKMWDIALPTPLRINSPALRRFASGAGGRRARGEGQRLQSRSCCVSHFSIELFSRVRHVCTEVDQVGSLTARDGRPSSLSPLAKSVTNGPEPSDHPYPAERPTIVNMCGVECPMIPCFILFFSSAT